ncbi:MAG: hypothetical protein NXI31_02195 [bacterium]|nr:hypothetical protein [bacterium]
MLQIVRLALALGMVAALLTAQGEDFRIHVIGASVSGGFRDGPAFGAKEQGDSVTLQKVLRGWADGEARVTSHNTIEMTAFFTKPLAIGRRQVDTLKRRKPGLVVAVDFPFWFAYGYVRGEEREARRERLAAGLAMLAEIEAPVVIGNLPDMTGAARRMLSPRQIPGAKLLAELNADLAKFAAERDNVHVLPLGKLVKQMRDVGIALPLASGPLPTPKGALQQEDRLHANRLGMAFLGHELQPVLKNLLPKKHVLRQADWKFEDFVEAAGADDELEVLVEAAKAEAKAAGGK